MVMAMSGLFPSAARIWKVLDLRQWACAHAPVRKQPDPFCVTLAIRMTRIARVLADGGAAHRVKRSCSLSGRQGTGGERRSGRVLRTRVSILSAHSPPVLSVTAWRSWWWEPHSGCQGMIRGASMEAHPCVRCHHLTGTGTPDQT